MDNLKKKGRADRDAISLREAWEVKYWTKRFGCSGARLRKAVKKVGHSVSKVSAYLER
jgi:hypothetical protein